VVLVHTQSFSTFLRRKTHLKLRPRVTDLLFGPKWHKMTSRMFAVEGIADLKHSVAEVCFRTRNGQVSNIAHTPLPPLSYKRLHTPS
jgi:hypothetical protein